jgi:hypothetical protein
MRVGVRVRVRVAVARRRVGVGHHQEDPCLLRVGDPHLLAWLRVGVGVRGRARVGVGVRVRVGVGVRVGVRVGNRVGLGLGIHIFSPSSTKSPPSRVAVARSAKASEPEVASERQNAPRQSVVRRGSHSALSRSLPQ